MNGRIHLRSIGLLLLSMALTISFNGCSTPEERVDEQIARAEALIHAGRPGEAVSLLEQLFADSPENAEIAESLAFAHAGNNNPGAAADAFVAAARLDPDRSTLFLYAAQARKETGNLAKTAADYRLYIAEHFDDPAGWRALAQIEEERGNHQDAIDAFLQLQQIAPSAKTALALGKLFLKKQNTAQAHQWFETAHETDPEKTGADALIGLLRISIEEENREEAEKLVKQLDSKHEGALDKSGLTEIRDELRKWRESVEEMKQREEEAAALAAKIEKEARERAEEKERLAREEAEEKKRREQEAEAKARKEAELAAKIKEAEKSAETEDSIVEDKTPEPNPFEQLLAEAAALKEEGDFDSAARLYWRAIADDDSNPALWFELSHALYKAERWNDAELTALETLRRDPDNEIHHLHYLNIISQTHSARSYLSELEKVHEKFPENPDIIFALAEIHAENQHSRQVALHFYRLFLRLAPDDSRRAKAEESIRRFN